MITKKQLIELLSTYPDDFEIVNEQNEPFIHMVNLEENKIVLSTLQPIGHCGKCGEYAYKEHNENLGYEGVCPTCDENLYGSDIHPLDPDKSTQCL